MCGDLHTSAFHNESERLKQRIVTSVNKLILEVTSNISIDINTIFVVLYKKSNGDEIIYKL